MPFRLEKDGFPQNSNPDITDHRALLMQDEALFVRRCYLFLAFFQYSLAQRLVSNFYFYLILKDIKLTFPFLLSRLDCLNGILSQFVR